jgi:hypothetical protein
MAVEEFWWNDFGDEVEEGIGGAEGRSSDESARLFDNYSFTCTLIHVPCSRANCSVTSGNKKSDAGKRVSIRKEREKPRHEGGCLRRVKEVKGEIVW